MSLLIPDIVMPKPYVLVTLTTDVLIYPLYADGVGLNLGLVQKIFDTSDLFIVGDTVLFDMNNALPIGYSQHTFYYVQEQYLFLKENIAP